MTRFETRVDIARPRREVFAYVADAERFADWNSAVERIAPAGGGDTRDGRYVMQRTLPAGRVANELEIAAQAPDALTIRTLSGPTPFVYRYAFEATDAGTRITLRGEVELGGAATVLGPLAGRAVRRGVDANLRVLRDLLERGG